MIKALIIKSNYENIKRQLSANFNGIYEEGSCFVICQTEYDDKGNVINDVFDIIHFALELGYIYVNTIVYPSKIISEVAFNDNVRFVIWLCKDKNRLDFNKDSIREKHIWKDVEWGKRQKNYNSKGKDPGNVWIPTVDDGKAHITGHILLSDDEIIKKLLSMTNAEECNEVINDDWKSYRVNREFTNAKLKEYVLQAKVFFNTSEVMTQIKNESIKTIVTSPPYWNLKDYFKKGQIGQESYETYVNRMSTVWKQCFYKLQKDGSLWININVRVHNNKVILIPYDIINSCKKIGFFYKGIFIWHKSSGIPAGPKNIGDHFEYILVFSKNETFNVFLSEQSKINDYKNNQINKGAFWNINRKAGSIGKQYIHPAIYPNELVSRVVLLSTYEGDTVSDPFLGSGTSLIASINENRSFVGIEFNDGFKELMNDRFKKELLKIIDIEYN
ncbi:MAG: site-specific DNA-methyltransferase [Anaeroplasmataceae bacterium]|nr:site-specific DNA-methyltransferase [Anaeroplasmataceae bacterium]